MRLKEREREELFKEVYDEVYDALCDIVLKLKHIYFPAFWADEAAKVVAKHHVQMVEKYGYNE